MEPTTSKCLFCLEKLERPPFQCEGDGTLTRVKGSLLFPSDDHDYSIPPVEDIPLVFSDKGGDSSVHDHLKTFFVLKAILKISDEVLHELLGLCEGKSQPENWVNVCCGCGKLVKKFYEDLKLICKLERRLLRAKWAFREKIIKSKGKEKGDDPISERIRWEAMRVYEDEGSNDNQIKEDIAASPESDGDTPTSGEEHFQMDGGTDEDDTAASPTPSWVPDSPSRPFEFWDSEEENDDNQDIPNEKTEKNKDSILKKTGAQVGSEEEEEAVSSDEEVETIESEEEEEEQSESGEEESPEPILVDLVSEDDDYGEEKVTPSQAQAKASTQKTDLEATTQKDTFTDKNLAQMVSQNLNIRSVETQSLCTSQPKINGDNQTDPNPSQTSGLSASKSKTQVACSPNENDHDASDDEGDVSSVNLIEIQNLHFGEVDDFQQFCNETNYGSDCELELEEVMWRAEAARFPPPIAVQEEHLPVFHILEETHDISELEAAIAAQNGMEMNFPGGNLDLIKIPDPGNPYYGLICAPDSALLHEAPPPSPLYFYLVPLEHPPQILFEPRQNETSPVLLPPTSAHSSSSDNTANLNLLAFVTETARVNGLHPTLLNFITQKLPGEQEVVESLGSELRIENHDDRVTSSATTSALNTPMCLSSADEEDSQKEIRALNGKRKQIFIKNSAAPMCQPAGPTIHSAIRCPRPSCGLLILSDSLGEHLRSHDHLPVSQTGKRKLVRKTNPPILKATHNYKQGYKTFQRIGKMVGYKCRSCPASFLSFRGIKKHLQLHVPGSKVKICGENHCGWFVDPNQMLRHRNKQHSNLTQNSVTEVEHEDEQSNSSSGSDQSEVNLVSDEESSDDEGPPHLEPEVNLAPPPRRKRKELSEVNSNSTPEYDVRLEKSGTKSCRHFYCRKCPYFSYHVSSIKNHLLCHKPGSEFIICKVCKWHVAPRRFKEHLVRRHPNLYEAQRKLMKQRAQSSTTSGGINGRAQQRYSANHNPENQINCPECNAFFASISDFEEHQRLHSGDGRLTCDVCGWTTKNLAKHKLKWHSASDNNSEDTSLPTPSPPGYKRKLPPPPQEENEEDTIVSIAQRTRDNSNPVYITITLDGTKIYKCRQCGARMRRLALLKSHLKVHDDQAAKVRDTRRSSRIKTKK